MSDDEQNGSFLARWSRRKAAAREAPEPGPAPVEEPPVPELPPIEGLGADSDYTVFLARGVSQAVQAQALRVAWASDPAIANFRGMAEYAWDFNAPGYGELAAGDDAALWLSRIVRSGANLVAAVEPAVAEAPAPDAPRVPAPKVVALVEQQAVQAVEAEPAPATAETEPDAIPVRRRHGGAMPA